ncbi:MAG: class I SAM-dependent methyltransferase [Terracidiphilus sp.]
MDTPGSLNQASQSTSAAPIPLHEKLRELKSIFLMRLSDLSRPASVEGVFADIAEYEAVLQQYSGRGLKGASALEIGFGARPLRLFALAAGGVDVIGSDLDVPLIHCSRSEIAAMLSRNGIERAVKSVLRFALFDLKERRELDKSLHKRGMQLKIEPNRLIVADAAELEIPARSLDFIYSEDVFEHIPADTLRGLVRKMAGWLKPSGVALIRPNVFTGIAGGHLAEWFPKIVSDHNRRRRSEPWEHLRKRRFQPNTYLNELSRASYRELFAGHFEILEERVRDPELGRKYLSPEVERDLGRWPAEELFSNQTLFILRPIAG